MPSCDRIGILGAGRAGTAFARAAARSNIAVQIASTRTPSQMRYHLLQYAPRAQAITAEDIGQNVDVVILAVPQEDLDAVDPAWLADRIVIDATNRWESEPIPTWLEAGLSTGLSSSEVLAQRFSSSRLVKALNHLSHWTVDEPPAGTPRGALVAADDAQARSAVVSLVERLGFSPVPVDTLKAGKLFEPDTEFFNIAATAQQLDDHVNSQ